MEKDFRRLTKKYNYDPTEAARTLGVTAPDEGAPRRASVTPTARNVTDAITRLRAAGVDNRLLGGIIKKQRRSNSW